MIFTCSTCNHIFEIGQGFVGTSAYCPRCGTRFQLLAQANCYRQQDAVQTPPHTSVRYAGFWIRFAATLVDTIVLAVPSFVAEMAIPEVGGTLLWIVYKGVCLGNWNGQTVGKKVCGIRVVDVSLTPCTVGQGFARTVAELLSAITLMIGYAMAAFDGRKQALHDKCAKTLHIYA